MAYASVVASFNVNGIKKLFVRSVVGIPPVYILVIEVLKYNTTTYLWPHSQV
jgi:hypothetical protein